MLTHDLLEGKRHIFSACFYLLPEKKPEQLHQQSTLCPWYRVQKISFTADAEILIKIRHPFAFLEKLCFGISPWNQLLYLNTVLCELFLLVLTVVDLLFAKKASITINKKEQPMRPQLWFDLKLSTPHASLTYLWKDLHRTIFICFRLVLVFLL